MRKTVFLAILLLAGCATTQEKRWMRGSSSEADFNQDSMACRSQALAVPGAMSGNTMQFAAVYTTCLRGKGWELVEVQR
jgi:hypothetical protein